VIMQRSGTGMPPPDIHAALPSPAGQELVWGGTCGPASRALATIPLMAPRGELTLVHVARALGLSADSDWVSS
jgi:hypothetical protein